MYKVNNPTYINISITHIAQVVKTVTATKFRHEPFQDFYEVFEEIGRWGEKMKAKISDWQLFNSSRSSTKSWRKVNPSQSVLGCCLSVLVSSCPGVLVPACVDIVWAGYGTPWPGLDYHKEWGWLAAYKKDARQTRQHTLGHTRALILPVCVSQRRTLQILSNLFKWQPYDQLGKGGGGH